MTLPDPTPHAPLRLALVGLGGHGRTIQQGAEETPGLEVVGVYDPVEEEARAAATRFGCPAAPSYEHLLGRDDVDTIVLVTPNHLHRTQAEAAFQAGKDVFVEKPIANTVADGLAMVEAAERAGRRLMVGHNMRFSRAAERARALLAEGRLGEVVGVELHFSSDTARRLSAGAWRLRPDQCPLLPVMQLGIHALDLVHALVGTITEVSAFARSVTTPPGVVDSVVGTFRIGEGPLGTLVSHYCTPVRFSWRITGTDAAISVSGHTFRFDAATPEDSFVEEHGTMGFESYARQMARFARSFLDGTPSGSDGWSGLQSLAVVEALEASARDGVPCRVRSFTPPSVAPSAHD